MKKLLSFLAMALLFVACQNELGQEVSNDALVSVKLNVTAQDLATRTNVDDDATVVVPGYSSALGAIQNFTSEDWANYDLRYTLEVYAAGDNGTGTPIGNARQVKTVDSYKEVFFEVRLAPNKSYKFVVFADFVNQGEESDLYYNTEDLRAITMVDGKMNPMNEARDAYFASKELLVKSSIEEPIKLQRPFGKLRVVTTDFEYVEKYAAPAKAKVTFYNCEVFKSFNAVNGAVSTARTEAENTYEYELGKEKLYVNGVDAEKANMTLFADYLLAKPAGQNEVYFTLSVYDATGADINSKDFNVAIPIQRNYLTTIKGNLLTTSTNIEVIIDHELKEGSTIDPEAKTLAVPAVSATLEGNAVTLTWDAVEGATSYFTRIVAEGNEFEETTECTKVYENLDWETTYTFEVYAACAEENLVSNTTSYEITTEAEPVVVTYKLYLNNEDGWSKVNVYAWDENGIQLLGEWPGVEMTEKESIDGVEYFVYALSAEFTGKTIGVIFNNGEGKQTADITDVEITKDNFFTNYVEPAVTETYLYLKPNANWKIDNARFAAYFFGAGETWVDATLVEGETDIYGVIVPGGYPNVIFCRMNPNATANNWNNKWNQTSDLVVPTDGTNLYTVKEGTWDSGNGTWSTYTAKVEPVVLETPAVAATVDGNIVALTWSAIEGAAYYTVQVDDDIAEEVNATSYTFEGDYDVEYTFTVKAIAADTTKNADSEAAVVVATTEEQPVVAPEEKVLTVAEFLALTDVVPSDATAEEIAAAPLYTLTGTITSVANTTYGNFYLNDGTGEVLIYGLVGPNGETKYWANSGAKVGDDITIKTIRTEYGNAPQGKNATFVEVKTPGTLAFWSFDSLSVSFSAAADTKDIELVIYNTTSEVVAKSDNAQFSATYTNGVLTITALENTTSDPIEGNITVTCGALSQVITVSQLGATSGEQTIAEATISFADKANRTTYTTSQQVWEQNGITVTNDKASSTTNVGDYSNPGRFYKGSDVTIKAPGAIISISINVSGLDSKYVTPWGTASNGIVTITLDGTSDTYKFTNLSAQARAYSMTVTYIE